MDPTSLRNMSWLELQYLIDETEQTYYVPIVSSSAISSRGVSSEKKSLRSFSTNASFVEDTAHITRRQPEDFERTSKRVTNAMTLRLFWKKIRLTHIPYLESHSRDVDAGMLRPSLSMMMRSDRGRVSATSLRRDSTAQTSPKEEKELMLESLFDYIKNRLVD